MTSDKNLLLRAAWITLIIALVGVGILYAVIEVADAEKPELLKIDWFDREQTVAKTPRNDAEPRPESATSVSDNSTASKVDFAAVTRDIAYIDRVFPVISSWELENIQPYFAYETLQRSEYDPDFGGVLAVLSDEFGTLRSWGNPVPDNSLTGSPLQPAGFIPKLSEYRFLAQYDQGVARVNMVLADEEGNNALYAFRIESVN